jgi:hypothetical protein
MTLLRPSVSRRLLEVNGDQRHHFLEVVVLHHPKKLEGYLHRLNFFRLTAIAQKEIQPGHQPEATCRNSSRGLQVAVVVVEVVVVGDSSSGSSSSSSRSRSVSREYGTNLACRLQQGPLTRK